MAKMHEAVVPPANETMGTTVHFRVDVELADEVEKVAKETGRSVSDVFRFLVRAGLAAHRRAQQ